MLATIVIGWMDGLIDMRERERDARVSEATTD